MYWVLGTDFTGQCLGRSIGFFSLCLLLCLFVWYRYQVFLSGLIIRPFLSELCCEASHLIFALIVLFVSVSGRAGIPVSARTFSGFSLSIHLSGRSFQASQSSQPSQRSQRSQRFQFFQPLQTGPASARVQRRAVAPRRTI